MCVLWYNSFIFKLLYANQGKGIAIYHSPEDALADIVQTGGGIVEQLIVQSDELASFNIDSVNTLRINTINYENEVDVLWPCLRMGRKGSVVDNAGMGGCNRCKNRSNFCRYR